MEQSQKEGGRQASGQAKEAKLVSITKIDVRPLCARLCCAAAVQLARLGPADSARPDHLNIGAALL